MTLKPDCSRLAANASAFRCGSGMYGRETLVGYQKSIGTGSVRPAGCRSCLRLRRAERVRAARPCPRSRQRRRQELGRDLSAAGVELGHDRGAVEPVGDRLADLQVVHRRDRLVDPDVADVERRPVEDLQVRVRLDRPDVLGSDEVVALDLTALQRLQPGRVVGDRPEDDPLQLRLRSPVARVARRSRACCRPATSSACTARCPIGCCVPNVPVGWKTPFESTVPASALYFTSAVGLAMPKFVSASAPRNDDERRVSRICTVLAAPRLAALVQALVRARASRLPDGRSRRTPCSSSRSRRCSAAAPGSCTSG